MIQAAPNAPDGIVKRLGVYDASTFVPGSAILCRNTAPLIGMCYALLQRDVPCSILGRDIGAALVTRVRKLRAPTMEDLERKLDAWRARECERLEAAGRSTERIEDQHACLMFFINNLDEDSRTPNDVLSKINLMFTEERNGRSRVTLSTVHKSKGLEYGTVFILDRDVYMPSKYAKLPWQVKQETNLIYVAITRAREALYYIRSDAWKLEEEAL